MNDVGASDVPAVVALHAPTPYSAAVRKFPRMRTDDGGATMIAEIFSAKRNADAAPRVAT
jgi:hypothetical protein